MLNALLSHTAAGQAAESHRHAYNAAFEELGLTWYWDAATYARLQVHGRNGVRVYLETEQSHLLRAYEADFLVNAIETTFARCHEGMGHRTPQAPCGWSDSRNAPVAARHNIAAATPSHRTAISALT